MSELEDRLNVAAESIADSTNRIVERQTTSDRMKDLARHVGDSLEAEANFSPSDWEIGEAIPGDIAEYLEDGWDLSSTIGIDEDEALDAMREALELAVEQWRETSNDSVLDIRAEVDVMQGGELSVRTVTIVLGTGGPHVEVELEDNGRGNVIAYDWFMEGLTRYPVHIDGHPLMDIVEMTIEQIDSGDR